MPKGKDHVEFHDRPTPYMKYVEKMLNREKVPAYSVIFAPHRKLLYTGISRIWAGGERGYFADVTPNSDTGMVWLSMDQVTPS